MQKTHREATAAFWVLGFIYCEGHHAQAEAVTWIDYCVVAERDVVHRSTSSSAIVFSVGNVIEPVGSKSLRTAVEENEV